MCVGLGVLAWVCWHRCGANWGVWDGAGLVVAVPTGSCPQSLRTLPVHQWLHLGKMSCVLWPCILLLFGDNYSQFICLADDVLCLGISNHYVTSFNFVKVLDCGQLE